MTAVAALVLLVPFVGCLAATAAVRRRPLGLAAALAAAHVVCLEAVLLQGLSLFQAVDRPGVLLGNAAIGAGGLAAAWWMGGPRPRLHGWRLRGPVPLLIAALCLLALASALLYRPNNWDSMTYRLARVAHWFQNRSVGAYPTNVPRQLVLPPGAEYLVLVLQVVSRDDRLAALVQMGGWLLLAAAGPPLARSFGAPRRVARWAGLLVVAAPMAVIQASSTQNDLVAAAMAVAIAAACLPFLHARDRWRGADVVLLASALTASLIVKPTSVVVTAPLLAWTALRRAPDLRFGWAWRRLAAALPSLVLAAAVLGPPLAVRRSVPDAADVTSLFVYSGLGQGVDRLVNSARGLARNVPYGSDVRRALDVLAPPVTVGCEIPNSLCLHCNVLPFEDCASSPVQVLLVVLASLAALAGWRSLPRRAALGLAALGAGWLLFHATFRDNPWITRLQLPLFALVPIALGGLGAHRRGRWIGPATAGLVAWAMALAVIAAFGNSRRPLERARLRAPASEETYYSLPPLGVADAHGDALEALSRTRCDRLGLFIGSNSYDYPLTWRAMQRGVRVRHVLGPDDWPCALFSDRGPPPPRPSGGAWRPTEAQGFYVAGEDGARQSASRDPSP